MEVKKTMQINDEQIEYFVRYKNIKKLYLRIEQGKIKINCPMNIPDDFIEHFLLEQYPKIKKWINQYEPMAIYQDGGYVYFLGRKYPLQCIDMQMKKVVIKKDRIVVYHRAVEKVLTAFLKDYLLRYIDLKIKYYHQLEPRFPIPDITLKQTKRRYGACFYRQNKVSFNPILVHKSTAFIDYVIVHELCHFIEPNHSKEFYHEVEKWIPDYKAILKEEKQNANHIT